MYDNNIIIFLFYKYFIFILLLYDNKYFYTQTLHVRIVSCRKYDTKRAKYVTDFCDDFLCGR